MRDVATWNAGWTKTVGRFLGGLQPEAEFLTTAERGKTAARTWPPCEAYYFAGMKALLAGDVSRARGLFEKSVATKETTRAVFMLARAELARLAMPDAPRQ